MTAPVADMRVSTVAPRPSPAAKGVGRPVGTPLTALEGFEDARGVTTAGLAPGRTWLVVVELEDVDGLVGVGTAGFGHPATVEVLQQLEPIVVGRPPLGSPSSGSRCTAPRSTSGAAVSSCTRSAPSTSRSGSVRRQLGIPVHDLPSQQQGASPPSPPPRAGLHATEDLRHAAPAGGRRVGGAGFGAVERRLPNGPLEGR